MIHFADNCHIYVSSTDPGGILENTHTHTQTHRENVVSPHSRTPTVWLLLLIPGHTPHTSLLYFLLRQGHSGHSLSLLPGQIPLLLGGPVQLPSTWQSSQISLVQFLPCSDKMSGGNGAHLCGKFWIVTFYLVMWLQTLNILRVGAVPFTSASHRA